MSTDQQTIAELAAHNVALTHDLFAAEQRAREDGKQRVALEAWAKDEQEKRHAAEDQRVEARSALAYAEQEVARLQHETAVLQRTVDMQQALVTATADVVAEVRKLAAVDHGVAWPDLVHALNVLDRQPQVRMAQIPGSDPT